MGLASYILEKTLGGKASPQPHWQSYALEQLRTVNHGYHPGRFINCMEITIHAFHALLLESPVFPDAPPLPCFPWNIPNYASNFHKRLMSLEGDAQPKEYKYYQSVPYEEFKACLERDKLPPYSHLIAIAGLKKLEPGGHVFSGILLPGESLGKLELFLYDAQNFIPDSWLEASQFDTFYSLERVYIHHSPRTVKAIKAFVEKCQAAIISPKLSFKLNKIQPFEDLHSIRPRLLEFLAFELFRLQAKNIVQLGYQRKEEALKEDAAKQEEEFKDKREKYAEILTKMEEQNTLSLTLESLLATAMVVKEHRYSYNWFDPQSWSYFRAFFNRKITFIQEPSTIEDCTQNIKTFIVNEVIRLSMINEYYNEELNKKAQELINSLTYLATSNPSKEHLLDILKTIKLITEHNRHYFARFLWSSQSSSDYQSQLKPMEEALKEGKYDKQDCLQSGLSSL